MLGHLIISRTMRAFEVKWKTFFLVSQVVSFRLTKETSKNVADITFKHIVKCHSSKGPICGFHLNVIGECEDERFDE